LAVASGIALIGATEHVGGWNDGSRLASVECLVDYGTWVIDHSTFTQPPNGTLDKLRVNGHYYSDKSPVPAVFMAGVYAAARFAGWPSAAERPDRFCWLLNLATAGLAYIVAAGCIDSLTRQANLPIAVRLTVVAGFAIGSLALPYSRSVNNHVLLLAVAAALLVVFDRMADGGRNRFLLVSAGLLTGLAYTIDLGAGPAMALGAVGLAAYRLRSLADVALVLTIAAPFPLLHHVLNWHIGGGFGPANANPAYFDWPGCPFNATTMTGVWNHHSIVAFALYAVDLLVGKKGFFGYNLPLLLAVPAAWRLLRAADPRRPEVLMCGGWMVLTWLLYSASSRNYSGACISVRWFVPLLAPGYYILIRALHQDCTRGAGAGANESADDGRGVSAEIPPLLMASPARPLLILTLAGILINGLAWRAGPWSGRMVPAFWLWVGAAIIALVGSVKGRGLGGRNRQLSSIYQAIVSRAA